MYTKDCEDDNSNNSTFDDYLKQLLKDIPLEFP